MSQQHPITPPPELVEWLRESLDCALQSGNSKSIKNHCRLLDLLGRPTLQPVPEPVALTDEEIEEWADACSEAPLEEMDPEVHGWRRCFTAKEFSETIRAALARWGHPTPQPEGGDIHYAWELHDAEGDWQAGGSAITLESVRREGNHYLQTYSQNGPHTLIIQRVSTIEEVTNG